MGLCSQGLALDTVGPNVKHFWGGATSLLTHLSSSEPRADSDSCKPWHPEVDGGDVMVSHVCVGCILGQLDLAAAMRANEQQHSACPGLLVMPGCLLWCQSKVAATDFPHSSPVQGPIQPNCPDQPWLWGRQATCALQILVWYLFCISSACLVQCCREVVKCHDSLA